MLSKPTVLLVGSGRLAKHLKYWNSINSSPLPLVEWNRKQDFKSLLGLASEVSHVWLAVSDAAIAGLAQSLPSEKTIVHFSGALNVEGAACAHPLMSFPQAFLPADVYPKIHFALNGADKLADLMPGFENSFTKLSGDEKSLYHALCVVAGNFPQLLWNRTQGQLLKLNIPVAATNLYINQVTENFINQGEDAITGPITRNDKITLQKNIDSLNGDTALQNIYRAFVQEFSV